MTVHYVGQYQSTVVRYHMPGDRVRDLIYYIVRGNIHKSLRIY